MLPSWPRKRHMPNSAPNGNLRPISRAEPRSSPRSTSVSTICARPATQPAASRLIVGVPGIGKTQLARKFAEQATRREGPRHISWMELNTRTLKAADLIVFMGMMKALGQEQAGRRAGRKVADIQPNTSRVGVGALSPKVEVSREHVRHAHDLTSLMRDSLDRGLWRNRALVITIDELQTVDAVGIETYAPCT